MPWCPRRGPGILPKICARRVFLIAAWLFYVHDHACRRDCRLHRGDKARDLCDARRGVADADGASGGATRGGARRRGDVSGSQPNAPGPAAELLIESL